MRKTSITIHDKDLVIHNELYNGTPGLYELIFMRKPNKAMITEDDEINYLDILNETSVYRRHYDPAGSLLGNRGIKYTSTIRPLLQRHGSSSGNGLFKKFSDKPVEYRYWNNVHELMDELRVLWSEKQAGHTGHDNEIIAILEELREDGYIESLPESI